MICFATLLAAEDAAKDHDRMMLRGKTGLEPGLDQELNFPMEQYINDPDPNVRHPAANREKHRGQARAAYPPSMPPCPPAANDSDCESSPERPSRRMRPPPPITLAPKVSPFQGRNLTAAFFQGEPAEKSAGPSVRAQKLAENGAHFPWFRTDGVGNGAPGGPVEMEGVKNGAFMHPDGMEGAGQGAAAQDVDMEFSHASAMHEGPSELAGNRTHGGQAESECTWPVPDTGPHAVFSSSHAGGCSPPIHTAPGMQKPPSGFRPQEASPFGLWPPAPTVSEACPRRPDPAPGSDATAAGQASGGRGGLQNFGGVGTGARREEPVVNAGADAREDPAAGTSRRHVAAPEPSANASANESCDRAPTPAATASAAVPSLPRAIPEGSAGAAVPRRPLETGASGLSRSSSCTMDACPAPAPFAVPGAETGEPQFFSHSTRDVHTDLGKGLEMPPRGPVDDGGTHLSGERVSRGRAREPPPQPVPPDETPGTAPHPQASGPGTQWASPAQSGGGAWSQSPRVSRQRRAAPRGSAEGEDPDVIIISSASSSEGGDDRMNAQEESGEMRSGGLGPVFQEGVGPVPANEQGADAGIPTEVKAEEQQENQEEQRQNQDDVPLETIVLSDTDSDSEYSDDEGSQVAVSRMCASRCWPQVA